jgi:hypothetical protein
MTGRDAASMTLPNLVADIKTTPTDKHSQQSINPKSVLFDKLDRELFISAVIVDCGERGPAHVSVNRFWKEKGEIFDNRRLIDFFERDPTGFALRALTEITALDFTNIDIKANAYLFPCIDIHDTAQSQPFRGEPSLLKDLPLRGRKRVFALLDMTSDTVI